MAKTVEKLCIYFLAFSVNDDHDCLILNSSVNRVQSIFIRFWQGLIFVSWFDLVH